MKGRYIITIDSETKDVTLEELGELNKEEFFTLTSNKYSDIITEKFPEGKEAIITSLRNEKFFPPYETVSTIADTIIHMVSENKNYEEILIDDKDYILESEEDESKGNKEAFETLDNDGEFINMIDEEISRNNIDENVNIEELLQDGDDINVSSGIKIADDEMEKTVSSEEDV